MNPTQSKFRHLSEKSAALALVFTALLCPAKGETLSIENDALKLTVHQASGLLEIQASDGRVLISRSGRSLHTGFSYQIERITPAKKVPIGLSLVTSSELESVKRSIRKEEFKDHLGSGVSLIVSEVSEHGIVAHFSYSLYTSSETGALKRLLVSGLSVINESGSDFRLFGAAPILKAEINALENHHNLKHLEGSSGSKENWVTEGADALTLNNLLLFGESRKGRTSVVAGGLRYREFLRWIETSADKGKIRMDVHLADPSGKLISKGTRYDSQDLSVISFTSDNPFEILEDYAHYFAAYNSIRLNYYDFPTICGWTTSRGYGHNENFNRSDLLVKLMRDIKATGFTRFAKVGMRLEPDTYAWRDNGNTSQGWWTDDRIVKYGKLAAPYETFEKFCQGILENDGIPLTYHQVNIPSRDFARAHPDWVMNNDLTHIDREYNRYNIFMDYTNPGWREHYLNVWKRWGGYGLAGIKFDYPQSGWIKDGGFEDPYATTTSTYRQNFLLCREGLGPKGFISERALSAWGNNIRGDYPFEFNYIPSDVCLGVVDIQRTAGDNSHIEPAMMALMGLRWYKSRVMVSYYPDSKALHIVPEYLSEKNKRKTISLRPSTLHNILSQTYFISGRVSLSTAFDRVDDATRHDLSRIFPTLQSPKSPRPVDAFAGKQIPQTYAYEVEPGWQQVMIVNTYTKPMSKAAREQMRKEMEGAKPMEELFYWITDDPKSVQRITVPLSGDQAKTGSLGLDPTKEYHVYDFWADEYVGRLKGTGSIESTLRGQQSRVLSVREVKDHPQVISTDRHIMQGMFELSDVSYSKGTLSGKLDIIENDPITLTIAKNGKTSTPNVASNTPGIEAKVVESNKDWAKVQFHSPQTQTIDWSVVF